MTSRPVFFRTWRLIAVALAVCAGGCGSTNATQKDDRDAPVAAAVRADAPAVAVLSNAAPMARAGDAYVLVSGGGTPLSNHYSQYLQAKAYAGFFARSAPAGASWVFFGAGNRDGGPAEIADVHRETKDGDLIVDSWMAGALPNNRPATRDVILRAFRMEVLPHVRAGGTLYLFIGDHGELAGSRDQEESAITLWQLKPARRRSGGWTTDEKEVLGVAELRQVIAEGIGSGRVVFCMTQCHSGGFHQLALPAAVAPPAAWFTRAPAWASGGGHVLRFSAAGFTATDMASPAAGCDPDPDPERWAGYERFMPEALLGIDLMTSRRIGLGTHSLAEAHEAATLVDDTIDKPRATSEQFLAAWAHLIETRLMRAPGLRPETKHAVDAYQRAVDRGQYDATDAAFRARRAELAQFGARLASRLRDGRAALAGTRAQLVEAAREPGESPETRAERRQWRELRRAWTDTLRPPWKAAVLAGGIPGLNGAALAFEKEVLSLEDRGRNFMVDRDGDETALLNEVYWSSGYAHPATVDRSKAEAVARWGAARRATIIAWGRASPSAPVRAAAEKLGAEFDPVDEPPRALKLSTAAQRVLFYRRVLAAWQFLLALDARAPLEDLRTLIALEELPVR